MDNEYRRFLNNNALTNFIECKGSYFDEENCSWYHSNWMLLRYLGMVSNPYWHKDFYQNAIRKFVPNGSSLLVMGTADFSMPFLCQEVGEYSIVISDICKTPLNFCESVSKYHDFGWRTKIQDIYDGIYPKYNAIINDAFITRFPYKEKRAVFEAIHDGLCDDGIYITTIRHGWNSSFPVAPNDNEKTSFIQKTIQSAKEKNVDPELAKNSALQYIEKMVSYPLRDERMLQEILHNLFKVEFLELATVKGECSPTEYYHIVLRKL